MAKAWVRYEELSWQNYLLRCATCLLCLTFAFVGVITCAIVAAPRGASNDPLRNSLDFIIPLFLCSIIGVLLVYLGVLKEREYLSEKLPECTWRRALIVLVAAGLAAPVEHLVFALAAFLAVFGAVFGLLCGNDSSPGRKLWGVAICDGLLPGTG